MEPYKVEGRAENTEQIYVLYIWLSLSAIVVLQRCKGRQIFLGKEL